MRGSRCREAPRESRLPVVWRVARRQRARTVLAHRSRAYSGERADRVLRPWHAPTRLRSRHSTKPPTRRRPRGRTSPRSAKTCAGQPVLAISASGKQWLSFNVREDYLRDLTIGAVVRVARSGSNEPMPAVVTELRPLGSFATWQAERAIGDHDRYTLRLRLDPQNDAGGLETGMTVWLSR